MISQLYELLQQLRGERVLVQTCVLIVSRLSSTDAEAVNTQIFEPMRLQVEASEGLSEGLVQTLHSLVTECPLSPALSAAIYTSGRSHAYCHFSALAHFININNKDSAWWFLGS
jgi:hypothetical protein